MLNPYTPYSFPGVESLLVSCFDLEICTKSSVNSISANNQTRLKMFEITNFIKF